MEMLGIPSQEGWLGIEMRAEGSLVKKAYYDWLGSWAIHGLFKKLMMWDASELLSDSPFATRRAGWGFRIPYRPPTTCVAKPDAPIPSFGVRYETREEVAYLLSESAKDVGIREHSHGRRFHQDSSGGKAIIPPEPFLPSRREGSSLISGLKLLKSRWVLPEAAKDN